MKVLILLDDFAQYQQLICQLFTKLTLGHGYFDVQGKHRILYLIGKFSGQTAKLFS